VQIQVIKSNSLIMDLSEDEDLDNR